MKKLTLLLIALLAVSCNNSEDNTCKCNATRLERSVIKDIATQTIISSTEWHTVTSEASGTDCSTNGNTISSGSSGSYILPGGLQYSQTEFKIQIVCK